MSGGDELPVPNRLSTWYAAQPAAPGSVVIAGDSHAQILVARLLERKNEGDLSEPWRGAFGEFGVIGRGVGGQTAGEIGARLPELLRHEPTRLFLFAGTNDVTRLGNGDGVLSLACRAVDALGTEAVVLSTILPVAFGSARHDAAQNATIDTANRAIAAFASERNVAQLDLHGLCRDPATGRLRADLTFDGSHLNMVGSDLVVAAMEPFLVRQSLQSVADTPS